MRVEMAKDRPRNHNEKSSKSYRNPNLLSHYHECASSVFYNDGRANEYLHNLFLKAAKNGEIERIRNFLKRSKNNNVNVDYKDKNTGNTAIFLAALGNHVEVVQLLLNYGADVTLHNQQGQSVIELAPKSIQHILLASVERQGVSHRHLLQAAWQGNVEVLRRLLSSQADLNVNCKNDDGMTPLLLVTRDIDLFERIERDVTERGYHPLDVLKELLHRKANVSAVSKDGRSALHYVASSKGNNAVEMANMILDAQDCSMGLSNEFSCFPIHIASREDNYPVLLALINGGVDVNVKGYNGQTPLHVSAAHGHERSSSALIDNGADVTLVDDHGNSPVDITTSKRVHRVLKEAWIQQTKNNSPGKRRSLSAPNQHSLTTAVKEAEESQITLSKEKRLSPRKPSSKNLNSTNILNSNSGRCSQSQYKACKPVSRSNSFTAKRNPPRTRNDSYTPQTKQVSSRSQETAIFTQERIELPKLSIKNMELNYPSSLQKDFPSLTNIQRMRLLTPGHSRSLPGTPCTLNVPNFGTYRCGSERGNTELSLVSIRRNKIPARIAPLPGQGSITPDLALSPNTLQPGSSLRSVGQVVDLDLLQNGPSYLTALAKLAISTDVVALASPPQPPTTPSDENQPDYNGIINEEMQTANSRSDELQLASFDETETISNDIMNSESDKVDKSEREMQEIESSLLYQTQTFSASDKSTFWIPNIKDSETAHDVELLAKTVETDSKERKTGKEHQEKTERERTQSMSSFSFYVSLNDVTNDIKCVSCNKPIDSTAESQLCTTCSHKQKSNSRPTRFWISMDGETSDGEAETPNAAKKIRYGKGKSKCTNTRKTKSLPSTCQPSMPYHVQHQSANEAVSYSKNNDLKLTSERTFIKELNTTNDNGNLELKPKGEKIENNNGIIDFMSESNQNGQSTAQTEEECNAESVRPINPQCEGQSGSEGIENIRIQSERTFVIESNDKTAIKEQMCLQSKPGSNDNNISCDKTVNNSCTKLDYHIIDIKNEQMACKTDYSSDALHYYNEVSTAASDHRLAHGNDKGVDNKPKVIVQDTDNTTTNCISLKDNESKVSSITMNDTDSTLLSCDHINPTKSVQECLLVNEDQVCQAMSGADEKQNNETDCSETMSNANSVGLDIVEGPKTAWSCNEGVQIYSAFPSPVPPSCPKPQVHPPISDNKTTKRKTSGKKGKKGGASESKKCTKNRTKSGKEPAKKGKKKPKKKDQTFQEITVKQSNAADAAYIPEPVPESCDVSVGIPSPDVDNAPTLSLDSRTFSGKCIMKMFPVLSPIPESPYSNTSTPRSIEIRTAKASASTESSNSIIAVNNDTNSNNFSKMETISQQTEDIDSKGDLTLINKTDDCGSEVEINPVGVHGSQNNSTDSRNFNDYDEVDGGIISRLFGMCIPRLNINNKNSDEEDLGQGSNDDEGDEDNDDDNSVTTNKEDKSVMDLETSDVYRDEINEDVEDMLQEILQNTDDIVVSPDPSLENLPEQRLNSQCSIQSDKIDDSDNNDDGGDDDDGGGGDDDDEDVENTGSKTDTHTQRLLKQRNKKIKQQWTMNYINQMTCGSESDELAADQEHEKLSHSSSNEVFMDDTSDNDSSYISCDSTPRCVSDCSTFESSDSVLSPQNSRGSTLNQDSPHGSVDITAHEHIFKTSQSSSSDSRSTISNNSVLSTQSFSNSRQFVRSRVSVGSVSSATSCGEEIQWQKGSILGKGGFGTVWLGLVNTGEMIAVKQVELSHNDDTEAEKQYEKLQEEVSLLKSLRHENIVRYIGTCLDENFVVNIFMEYVPGGSIAQALKRFGAFVEPVFRHYTKQILCGVEYLHENNVIHRDIKGGNIMLMPKGVIKLIDFGCAKRLCMNLSLSRSSMLHSIKGTPYWMAPEVIKEIGAGTKSDIWSIGCTVFEMATGSPPWSEMQPMAAIFSIGSGSTIPQLGESFSQLARDFTTTCMTREPDARPSATELLQHQFLKE